VVSSHRCGYSAGRSRLRIASATLRVWSEVSKDRFSSWSAKSVASTLTSGASLRIASPAIPSASASSTATRSARSRVSGLRPELRFFRFGMGARAIPSI
jgi:hypothetical protein